MINKNTYPDYLLVIDAQFVPHRGAFWHFTWSWL